MNNWKTLRHRADRGDGGEGRRRGDDQRHGGERDDDHGDGGGGQRPNGERTGEDVWRRQGGYTRFTYVTLAPTVTITGTNPTGAKATTVGATAATNVVVVNATRFTAEGHQADRGDGGDDRRRDVTSIIVVSATTTRRKR